MNTDCFGQNFQKYESFQYVKTPITPVRLHFLTVNFKYTNMLNNLSWKTFQLKCNWEHDDILLFQYFSFTMYKSVKK
jgi:hypothetical protein